MLGIRNKYIFNIPIKIPDILECICDQLTIFTYRGRHLTHPAPIMMHRNDFRDRSGSSCLYSSTIFGEYLQLSSSGTMERCDSNGKDMEQLIYQNPPIYFLLVIFRCLESQRKRPTRNISFPTGEIYQLPPHYRIPHVNDLYRSPPAHMIGYRYV